jgi:glycine cleavage system aminomethyltransferase T
MPAPSCNRICGADGCAPGKIVYTDAERPRRDRGDLTVTRLSETAFWPLSRRHLQRDLAWLRAHVGDDFAVITDVTAAESVLCVMGPKSRDLMAKRVAQRFFSNAAHPFGTAQEIEIGMGLARAHRVTYVGELGWELYVADRPDRACLRGAGRGRRRPWAEALRLHTLDSCRIEKAYRHFGHDITDEDHVLEAGLGFAVSRKKGFLHRPRGGAAQEGAGLKRRCCSSA